jgi:hypothetical protein
LHKESKIESKSVSRVLFKDSFCFVLNAIDNNLLQLISYKHHARLSGAGLFQGNRTHKVLPISKMAVLKVLDHHQKSLSNATHWSLTNKSHYLIKILKLEM